MIRRLSVLLAKAIGASQEWQHGDPPSIRPRQQDRMPQKKARNDDVVGVVDDIFKAVAVKPRNLFLDPDDAREGAVGGVNNDGQRHEPKGVLETFLFNADDGSEGNHGPERRVEVDEPSEDNTRGHSANHVAEAAKLALALRRVIQSIELLYLGSSAI